MGIAPRFTMAEVRARFDKFLSVVEKREIERLQYLGEMCVTHARSIPPEVGFHDQTGNLRASIGYVVFKNGIAIREDYEGSSEGVIQGKALAKRVGSKYTSGISLIVTAGMSYAVAVESRGRDVLTSAEQLAKHELPRMMDALKRNINKALE